MALAENVLAPLGITVLLQQLMLNLKKNGSVNTTLIISNEDIKKIIKIIQALEDSNLLLKAVTKAIKNETKEQIGGFLSMLLGTLGTSLLGNLLTAKAIVRAGSENKKGNGIVRAGTGNEKRKGIVRAGTEKEWDFQCRLIL